MSAYVEDVDYAAEGECKDFVRRINEEDNRFSYPWQDKKGDWYPHEGSVTAKWDSDEKQCRIVFEYDDGMKIPVSFKGAGGFAHFVENEKEAFKWINGEPKWAREALKRVRDEEDAAEGLQALEKFRAANREAVDLIREHGHKFRFIEYNDADVSDYRAEASQKWQKAKVENLMTKISQLELEKDDPSLCEKMKKECEKEKMPWVCEANNTYQKECSSNSGRENIKKRGGGTTGEAPPPPLSFKRR